MKITFTDIIQAKEYRERKKQEGLSAYIISKDNKHIVYAFPEDDEKMTTKDMAEALELSAALMDRLEERKAAEGASQFIKERQK